MRYMCGVITAFWLFLCITGIQAFELGSGSEVSVRLAGAAGVQVHEPSGQKGFAGTVGYLSFRHAFNERVYASVALRGSEAMGRPFIHEGLIGWQRDGFQVEGGFLNDRFGHTLLHSARLFVHPLFEEYVLWDTYGAGVRLSQQLGPVCLGGSASLNNLESGSVHLTAGVAHGLFEARLLGGFQTYDIEQQDNLFVLGGESAWLFGVWGVHVLAVYERYLGYGSATNPTMRPGWLVDGYLEAFVAPIDQLRLSGLLRYTRYEKRHASQSLLGSTELECIPLTWLGFGMGLDALWEDAITSWAPMLFVDLQPVPEAAELRIYGNRRVTGDSSPTYTVGGTIWVDF